MSRPGARCRCCHRSVSPGRSPNPPCVFPRNGLSTASAVRRGWRPKGLGILVPRYRYREIGTIARLNSSIPSAVGLVHRPCGPVWCRRTSRHFQRCSFRDQRITLCHTKFSRALMVCLATACTQRRKMLPPPGIQIFSSTGRDQHCGGPPRIPAHHRQHRQGRSAAGLATPDRHRYVGKPEITLRDLTGLMGGARRDPAADTTTATRAPAH